MVDLLFTIALFGVFAISALSVILIGADVYRSVTGRAATTYSTRTALSYIAQKFHSMDTGCPAELLHFTDTDALVLYQEYHDELYATYIYEKEGTLRELFTRADTSFDADAGNTILESCTIRMEQVEDSLFYLEITAPDQQSAGMYLRQKSEGRKLS